MIKIENLNKKYNIFDRKLFKLFYLLGIKRDIVREHYVLKNINIHIREGEAVAIIGENGSGKSTLFKIISGIAKQSSGNISVKGRIGAILELGVGFDPELTGLENIYNYLVISNIKSQKDDTVKKIIEFSEIGEAIYQPIKTYSSGMYLRLAFSTSFAIEPDILIIDEALSVGDLYFQKKSLNKLLELQNAGKTILFCSHSMYHVRELCKRCIWLKSGEIAMDGDVDDVVNSYTAYMARKSGSLEKGNIRNYPVKIEKLRLFYNNNNNNIILEMTFNKLIENDLKVHVGIGIKKPDNEVVIGYTTNYENINPVTIKDKNKVKLKIKNCKLINGEYLIVGVILDDTGLLIYDMQTSHPIIVKDSEEKGFGSLVLEHEWNFE